MRLAIVAARLPWFIHAKNIALYWPADGEIDPRTLLRYAWRRNKKVFLPRLRSGFRLQFVEYKKNTAMRRNRFGIPEPVQRVAMAIRNLDVICLPLVGFDRKGGRLGMGGGFYDRTFARRAANRKPLLIGLAHHCQEVEQLPCEPWDIPLAGVVTDRESISTDRR